MKATAVALLAALALAPAPGAADDPAALLRLAEERLAAARSGPERLAALGAAAGAQEAALALLRAGLRAMPARAEALRAQLGPTDGARLAALAALHRAAHTGAAARLVHPGGPLGAARATMLLGAAAGALTERTAALDGAIAALEALEAERRAALVLLGEALAATEATRLAVAEALARRQAPALAEADRLLAKALAEPGATFGDLAVLLARLAPDDTEARAQRTAFDAARGRLPLPVSGEAEAKGATLAVRAPAWAMVRAPWLATVRHAGAVGPVGGVIVLETAPGTLVVLRGLGQTQRQAGEVVRAGEPLGSLGGPLPTSEEFLIDATHGAGTPPPETLYIDLWRDGVAEMAGRWFAQPR